MEKLPFAVRMLISASFKGFKEGPFLTKTVGELMWGFDSGLVDFLNKYLPGMLPTKGKFGLFAEVSGAQTAKQASEREASPRHRTDLGFEMQLVTCPSKTEYMHTKNAYVKVETSTEFCLVIHFFWIH